jgi:hypothetical protein
MPVDDGEEHMVAEQDASFSVLGLEDRVMDPLTAAEDAAGSSNSIAAAYFIHADYLLGRAIAVNFVASSLGGAVTDDFEARSKLMPLACEEKLSERDFLSK